MPTPDTHAIEELAALPSLGQTSARMLIDAGIPDVRTLRCLGPIESYRRLRFIHGKRATLNFVYAMECAIHGLDWRILGAERKSQLKAQARAVEASLAAGSKAHRRIMTKSINITKCKAATGRDFKAWHVYLKRIGAENLSHKDIAAHLVDKAGVDGWWAQSITVAYEQHMGRRQPGQRHDGTFTASVSRTLDGAPDRWFAVWCALMARERSVAGHSLSGAPTTTHPKSGSNWRCRLADGSRVTMGMVKLSPSKSRAAIEHSGLAETDVSAAKSYWRAKLAELK